MRLVIGGYAQGKLDYVLEKYNLEMKQVWDGKIPVEAVNEPVVFYRFHEWMKTEILNKNYPEETILNLLKQNQDIIIISDEIGNGIVPIDALEREYRERTGRILIELAKQAESVERVICGIGQKIK